MLYGTQGHVILNDCSYSQCFAELDRFLCVRSNGKYQTFVQARTFPKILDDDGKQIMDPTYSGYNLVTKSTSTMKIIIVISQKVLYPYNMANDPDAAIVVDFGRKSFLAR